MTSICLGYTTFPDEQTAETVSVKLLEDKLIACVNLFPKGISIYEWEGEIKRSTEIVGFMKTTPSCVPMIMDSLKAHHPHICPCFLTFSTDDGLPEFLDWVQTSVRRCSNTSLKQSS